MLLLSFLLFASSCKKGTGQMTWVLEVTDENYSAADSKKMEEAYQERLVHAGIDADDIHIVSNGKNITVEISEWSKYQSLGKRIPRLLESGAHPGFWESYSTNEIFPSLMNCFRADSDSVEAFRLPGWQNFATLVRLQPPVRGVNNCLLGYVALRDTARVHQLLDSVQSLHRLPADLRFAWTAKGEEDGPPSSGIVLLKAGRDGKARLDNPALSDIKVEKSANMPAPAIMFRLEGAEADAWRRMTRDNISRSVPIVVDGLVYSWPTVQMEISGGVSSITGNYSKQEAETLGALLRAPLPVHVRIKEQNIGK